MGRRSPSYLLIRNGRFSIRARVPRDLVAALGRAELVRSLGTSNGASARAVAAAVALRMGRLWAVMRKSQTISKADLQRLADAWLKAETDRQWALLDAGEFARRALPDDMTEEEKRARNRHLFGLDAEHMLEAIQAEVAAGDYTRTKDLAARLLATLEDPPPAGGHAHGVLAEILMRAMAAVHDARCRWVDGEVGYVPKLTAPADPPATAGSVAEEDVAAPQASRTVAEAIQVYVAGMRQRGAKEKQVIDAQGDLRLLVDAFGADRRVADITPADAGRLWEALRSLPPHFRTRPELAGLDLFQKAERARELGLPPLHFRSVDSYLRTLRAFFRHEQMAGQVQANPFDGKRAIVPSRVVKQERTFKAEELEALFSSPLFQGARSEARPYRSGDYLVSDWRFWAPLIALLSGARVGEIAQLRPRDIREERGFAVIDINAEDGKALKNSETARLIPIHSCLIELGLLRLAEVRKQAGHTLLLPEVPGPILGDHGAGLSKWMSERFLPRLGLKTRVGLGFHSFRHTLKTLLRNAHVPDSVSNNICGHDERTVAGEYGETELKAMQDALEKVELPEAVKRIQPRQQGSGTARQTRE